MILAIILVVTLVATLVATSAATLVVTLAGILVATLVATLSLERCYSSSCSASLPNLPRLLYPYSLSLSIEAAERVS